MLDLFKGRVTAQDWAFVGVVLAIIAGLVVAFVFFLYGPKQTELEFLASEDDQVLRDLALAKEKERNSEALKAETERNQRLVNEFEERLPKEWKIPTLITEFEELAKEVGLEVNLEPLPKEDDGRKETIPYSVTAYGNFHQITTFINLLERHRTYFKVSELEIKEQKLGISEAKFTISTFRIIDTSQEAAS